MKCIKFRDETTGETSIQDCPTWIQKNAQESSIFDTVQNSYSSNELSKKHTKLVYLIFNEM